MGIVNSVFEISNEFMKDADFVEIDYDILETVAENMLHGGQQKFKEPVSISTETEDDIYISVMKQLAGGAINYCYWYGKSHIRPNGCSSGKMFEVVERASEALIPGSHKTFCDLIIAGLARNRFPLLEERVRHIEEIENCGHYFVETIMDMHDQKPALESLMELMITMFPGYASDIFLKRASLFFMMLYRFFGWFSEELHHLHIPADYQVPKMLQFFGCINYTEDLWHAIMENTPIPKYSQAECEIRAATIIACQKLGELTGWNAAEVDGWFWLKRKECNDPFHLTVTTDY